MLDELNRHYPAKTDRFEFDKEVSRIFPDMAIRAIPNFELAHQVHVSMIQAWLAQPGTSVLDIGASRGAFFAEIKKQFPEEFWRLDLHAMDLSMDMCNYLMLDFSNANITCDSLVSPDFLKTTRQYDVVCCHYVLQFIHPSEQDRALRKVMELVKPGGILILGHKSAHHGLLGEEAHEQYMQFRIRNGYTREEIQAKTKALKGAMYPMDHGNLLSTLSASFREVVETTRFMMFSSLIARK